jgi:hypothetical protein
MFCCAHFSGITAAGDCDEPGRERGRASPVVADIGPALVLRHAMVLGSPVPDSYLASIVDDVLLALCADGR